MKIWEKAEEEAKRIRDKIERETKKAEEEAKKLEEKVEEEVKDPFKLKDPLKDLENAIKEGKAFLDELRKDYRELRPYIIDSVVITDQLIKFVTNATVILVKKALQDMEKGDNLVDEAQDMLLEFKKGPYAKFTDLLNMFPEIKEKTLLAVSQVNHLTNSTENRQINIEDKFILSQKLSLATAVITTIVLTLILLFTEARILSKEQRRLPNLDHFYRIAVGTVSATILTNVLCMCLPQVVIAILISFFFSILLAYRMVPYQVQVKETKKKTLLRNEDGNENGIEISL